MASVTVEIPDDLLAKLKNESGEPEETLRRMTAFFMCSRGELSTSQAARLAGMTYGGFLQAAASGQGMRFPLKPGGLQEEATRGFTLRRSPTAPPPACQGGGGWAVGAT